MLIIACQCWLVPLPVDIVPFLISFLTLAGEMGAMRARNGRPLPVMTGPVAVGCDPGAHNAIGGTAQSACVGPQYCDLRVSRWLAGAEASPLLVGADPVWRIDDLYHPLIIYILCPFPSPIHGTSG